MTESKIISQLDFLDNNLVKDILLNAQVMDIPKDTVILNSGQYIKVIPLVLDGLIKVFSSYEDKELLLYYLEENETCIMSYSACLKNKPSKVLARAEENTTILALPAEKMNTWLNEYPQFSNLFSNQYDKRYADLLDTINHLIFDKLDVRVLDYLKKKTILGKNEFIKSTHKQIAEELGTAREVISRILKKLEQEEKIEITPEGIKVN